ncbi:MAG TPA: D-alanyl-D-alanine carboxypeptidase [Bacteriovoracaceae bacterium]|nr:D-alanyl-D-alanine carboxypeptidase [Bacteriovoracaceae bacterium]
MKFIFLIAMILGTTAASANSLEYSDRFEDAEEFNTPTVEDLAVEAAETSSATGNEVNSWSYVFTLIKPNGKQVPLSEHNRHAMLKPASTIKLFTAYWAFKNKTQSHTFLGKMLKTSDNDMAQATLNELGDPSDMRQYYENLGLPVEAFYPVDGSGLDYANGSSCDFQIAFLSLVRRSQGYQTFRNLLAQPGALGTLENRLKELRGLVYAKTGTLNRTSNLSGFIETKKGTVIFCVVGDYLRTSSASARQKIDEMVRMNINKVNGR